MTEMSKDKKSIRKQLRALRDAVPPELRAEWTQRICARVVALPAFHTARTVHLFLSFQSEVDTRTLIEAAFALGKRVVVPVFVKDSEDTPCTQITSLDDNEFTFGKWDLRTPKMLRPVPLDEIDLVFVPMVAFEPQFEGSSGAQRYARIGYGAGFYDTFLKRVGAGVPKIGLAFAMQRADHIPIEPHDVLLDDVITEA